MGNIWCGRTQNTCAFDRCCDKIGQTEGRQSHPQNRTAALLAAFGCALAYLPAGRALAAVCAALPLSAAGQSFALHCAAAPLAEELVFRGAVQGLLQPLGPRAAVCVQAALFAVQHGGAAGIAYALVLGVLLGTIRQRTGRVWPGWVLHTVNNLLVFAAG